MTTHLVDSPGDRQEARRWLGWLLLLPLPVIGWAIWSHDLLQNVKAGYLWMLLYGLLGMLLSGVVVWAVARKSLGTAAIPTMAAILVAAAFVNYAGAAATMAALLLAVAALGIGTGVDAGQPMSGWARLLIGLAVLAGVVGWLLPFQIHDSRIYLLLVAAIGLSRRDSIRKQLAATAAGWRELADSNVAWLTLVVAAVAVGTLGLWLPSVTFDDNAAHLILPDQLLADGYYRMDVSSQIWAVAPWLNNVLHGIAALLAGQESRPSVNLLWLLVGVSGAYRLAVSLGAARNVALAAASVYATQPLAIYYGMCMQVDGAVAAILLHFAAILVADKGRLSAPVSIGALLGLLAGLKASNVIYVFLPLLWLAWNGMKHREWTRLSAMLATAALVGGSSYAYAMAVTGNPIFPLFNAIFHSPYMPFENFHDRRWDSGVEWRFLWDLTFSTTRFGEHYPGAAGIALLAVLSGLCAELLRPKAGRWVGLWFLAAGLLMFSQIQYLRYIFPAMAVLTTVGLVGLSRHVGERTLALAVALIVSTNAMLMPTTIWIARDNPWRRLVDEGASARIDIERSVIPERALLERLRLDSPGACALMTDQPFVGGFGGHAIAMTGYDLRLSVARRWANEDPSGIRWQRLLRSVGASHVVLAHQTGTALMKSLAASGYVRVDSLGGTEVWASANPGNRNCDPFLRRQRDQAHRLFHRGDKH